MRLIKAEVDQHEGYANDPELVLTVDKMPKLEDHRFEWIKTQGSDLYYSQLEDGHVLFFAHTLENERGYGGSVFKLKMKDGTTRKIKGPWSSRSGAMNHYFPHCVDVTIIEESTGCRYGASVSVKLAREAAYMSGYHLVETNWHEDIMYKLYPGHMLDEDEYRGADYGED